MSVYNYSVKNIKGENISLSQFEGQVLLIVNTASKCGLTPQFTQLQELYDQYKDKGLMILGFPCNQFMNQDPGTDNSIQEFCSLNYGVTFPMFSKIDVNGDQAHPLFKYLTTEAPGALGLKSVKWNFTKFLIDRQGNVVKRYSPQTNPKDIEEEILRYL